MVHGPGDPYLRLSPYLKRVDDGRSVIVLDEGMARWKCPRGYVEDVAAAIALAVLDDRAAGQVYNVAESDAFAKSEWARRIGEVLGWNGEVVTVPGARIPLLYRMDQSLDTDSGRIRRKLGSNEAVSPQEGLERSAIVANCRMDRERDLIGSDGYSREIGFDPVDYLRKRTAPGRRIARLDFCCSSGGALIQSAWSLVPKAWTSR